MSATIHNTMLGCVRYAQLLIAGLVAVGIGAPVFAYSWTDASGKHSIEAEFVALEGGVVKLRRVDGRVVSVSLHKLSKESQEHAQQLNANGDASNPFEASVADPTSSDPFPTIPPPENPASGTMTVIAEGVGSTADDALKDAFRNAVRQVVGAVVDAETLVKNDALIDEILTYSDGFVKSYDELDGSKKVVDGLNRVKIAADIERRSVIAKLKAVNVTIAELDGQNLYAEATSQAEAEKDATRLLRKALADLPTLLTAEVVGERGYDRTNSEITLTVAVRPDLKAYDVFVRRLEETLRKVAIATDSALIKGKPLDETKDHGANSPTYITAEVEGEFPLDGPPITEDQDNAWCIWVCSADRTGHTNLRWNAYVVDADAETVLAGVLQPEANLTEDGVIRREIRTSQQRSFRLPGARASRDEFIAFMSSQGAKTTVSLQFIGSNQSLIIEDEFELASNTNPPIFGRSTRSFERGTRSSFRSQPTKRAYLSLLRQAAHTRNGTLNLYVAPYSFTVSTEGLLWQTGQFYPRRVNATLDELKQIESVQCKVALHAER